MGSSEAQNMEPGEVSTAATGLLAFGTAYSLLAGKILYLNEDHYIINPQGGDAHGFVFVPEVAWAISQAILVWGFIRGMMPVTGNLDRALAMITEWLPTALGVS